MKVHTGRKTVVGGRDELGWGKGNTECVWHVAANYSQMARKKRRDSRVRLTSGNTGNVQWGRDSTPCRGVPNLKEKNKKGNYQEGSAMGERNHGAPKGGMGGGGRE